jgi:hypothetical protein
MSPARNQVLMTPVISSVPTLIRPSVQIRRLVAAECGDEDVGERHQRAKPGRGGGEMEDIGEKMDVARNPLVRSAVSGPCKRSHQCGRERRRDSQSDAWRRYFRAVKQQCDREQPTQREARLPGAPKLRLREHSSRNAVLQRGRQGLACDLGGEQDKPSRARDEREPKPGPREHRQQTTKSRRKWSHGDLA